jgi:hypothetical protein
VLPYRSRSNFRALTVFCQRINRLRGLGIPQPPHRQ